MAYADNADGLVVQLYAFKGRAVGDAAAANGAISVDHFLGDR